MWILDLARDTFAAFLGGSALTFVLFWLRERVFPLPRINGRWFVETETKDSALATYKGMLLKHELIIWQEGAVIRGTSEKIYEASQNGRRQFEGKNRARGELNGYVDKFYFSKDRVRLHVTETGEERTSTTFLDLIVEGDSLRGIFMATAGSSSGNAYLSRERYSAAFQDDVRNEMSDRYGASIQIEGEAKELQAEL